MSAIFPFQSTLPARGATFSLPSMACWMMYFNPRSPHGERRFWHGFYCSLQHFNPRSPHGERQATVSSTRPIALYFNPRSPHGERRKVSNQEGLSVQFQSTLPARGATPTQRAMDMGLFISIHAPRTGSDGTRCWRTSTTSAISIHAPRTGSDPFALQNRALFVHFNPRSPHGERPEQPAEHASGQQFQSTLPARGATVS